MATRSKTTLAPSPTPKDLQEEEALERASSALKTFMEGGGFTPRSLAAVAISEWIIARTRLCASEKFDARLMFDLKDARLRGYVETALPAIGKSVMHLPADIAFFELDKEAVIDLFVAGIKGAREAEGAAAEALGAPFDDSVPF